MGQMEIVAGVGAEIPTDEEVLAIVETYSNGVSASELLQKLLHEGHTRANAQRAMQRCLDRDRIRLNLDLMVLSNQLALAA
jgi:hypothetical protein